MSATPRPWKRVCSYIGSEEYPVGEFEESEDAEFIIRAVNAFDALLAVAKAVNNAHGVLEFKGTWQALERLDAAHPGWREWTS